jgi:nitrogen fixation protein NifB
MKIAIATSDGKFISRHFGNTPAFLIAEADEKGWRILDRRQNDAACEGGAHDPERFERTLELLSDCGVVLAAKIGGFAQHALRRRGVPTLEKPGFVGEVLDAYVQYAARKKRGFLGTAAKLAANDRQIDFSETTPAKPAPDNHPCFDEGAHGKFGRIHLPVASRCNIKCRFCERSINAEELRPGVTAGVLSPEQAAETVERALALCPELTVIGVAGLGDALADDAALEAFALTHGRFPELSLCLSTNGLGLPGKAQALYNAGVRYLTVTVNAATAETGAKIIDFIRFGGEIFRGGEAAGILLKRQTEGIREAAALGFNIKINTVLIPGVNAHEIGEIARLTAALGARRHNIMPLIPCAGMKDLAAPTCAQLDAARTESEKYLQVFRKCAHCRADACGIPGVSDVSKKLYETAAGFRCNNVCG